MHKRVFAGLAAILGLALAPVTGIRAQPSKSIEVASVKPSRDSTADSNLDSVRGRLTATNITLRELIRFAYGMRDSQIEQAPPWVGSERFDVVAKRTSSGSNSIDEEKSLVRELLIDRFGLVAHETSKEMPVYLLVAAKRGPKLEPHDDTRPKTRGWCGRLVGRRVTADYLASMLARQLDREVLNQTGLRGEYDIELTFAPDSGPCRAPLAGDSQSVSATDPP